MASASPFQQEFVFEERQSFLDDAEPRPPPRVPRIPIPFNMMEVPRPKVPDVSLIFDSAGTAISNAKAFHTTHSSKFPSNMSPQSSIINQNAVGLSKLGEKNIREDIEANCKENIQNVNIHHDMDIKIELNALAVEIKSQKDTISKMDEKLEKIIHFQEKFLSQLFLKGSAISKEVQTDKTPPSGRSSSNTSPETVATNFKVSKSKQQNEFADQQTRSEIQNKKSSPFRQPLKGPLGRVKTMERNEEDLSAILKDIQLPNMNEPSVFSEPSGFKSLELQEFNDESFQSGSGMDSPILGASASAFGSSPASEEELEVLKPTATFYNNVLGNVNRLLEGGCSKKKAKKSSKNATTTSQILESPINSYQQSPAYRREVGLESSGISANSSSTNESTNHANYAIANRAAKAPKQITNKSDDAGSDEVVQATKRYLEKLGVQFGSPSASEKKLNVGNNSRNYMIQQNVYNSIYIPTVNCAPGIPEALDSNANSGNFDVLAKKYGSPDDLMQFEALKGISGGKNNLEGTTDATFYGMSPNNLSFATKEYLQRYGLVNQQEGHGGRRKPGNSSIGKEQTQTDRILDINAIKNQPKFL